MKHYDFSPIEFLLKFLLLLCLVSSLVLVGAVINDVVKSSKNKTKEVPINLVPPVPPIKEVKKVDINNSLKSVAEKTGLTFEQRIVLQEIARGFVTEINVPPETLVSLGKTVSKFADALTDDSISNHGAIKDVEFEEIKTWKRVSRELNKYKYE